LRQETLNTLNIVKERFVLGTYTLIHSFTEKPTTTTFLAGFRRNIEKLCWRTADTGSIENERSIRRASDTLLLVGIIKEVSLTRLTFFSLIIKVARQVTSYAWSICLKWSGRRTLTSFSLIVELFLILTWNTGFLCGIKIFRKVTSNTFCITDSEGRFRATNTFFLLEAKGTALKTVFTQLSVIIPYLEVWTDSTVLTIEVWIAGWAVLALERINVENLIRRTWLTHQCFVVEVPGMETSYTSFVVPEEPLLLITLTGLRGLVVSGIGGTGKT